MKENDWTKSICELLQNQKLGENIYIDTLKKIPYALEISSFNEEWEGDCKNWIEKRKDFAETQLYQPFFFVET